MDTYETLRQFADTWVLLAMFLFFIGVVLWVLRPGSSEVYEDVAAIPLRNDDATLAEEEEVSPRQPLSRTASPTEEVRK